MRPLNLTPCVLYLDGSLGENLRGCPYLPGQGDEYDLVNLCFEDWYRGAWRPKLLEDTTVAAALVGRKGRPAPSSVFQYAHAAASVIAWSEVVSNPNQIISIRNYDEEKLAKYQSMMISGEWSVDGEGLRVGTIERRLMVAISIAEWAYTRGYRGPTDFMREPTADGGWRYALLRTPTRFRRFPLPSSNLGVLFLRAVASDRSYFLAASTIIFTGLRISELCRLNVNDIPFEGLNDSTWKGAAIDILGKGDVERPVTFPRRLVETTLIYIQQERPQRLEICERRYGKNSEIYKDAERALFLNGQGRRLAKRSTWAAFVKFGALVNLKVHPHLLRHWFAANRLRKRHELLLAGNPNISPRALKEDLATVIGSIQRELGHKKLETTLIYLESYFDEIAQDEKFAIANEIMDAVKV